MINKEKFVEIFQSNVEDFLNKEIKKLENHTDFNGRGHKAVKVYIAESLQEFSNSILLPALEAIIDEINN